MELSDELLKRIPNLTTEAIDAEQDRQLIKRHREAHDRAYIRGEKFDYPPEYVTALRRCGWRIRDKLDAAYKANVKYEPTREHMAEMTAILHEGRARVARLAKAREEWQKAHAAELAALPIATTPSDEEHDEELRPPEAPANPQPLATTETASSSVQKAPTTQKEVDDMIREIRRKTVAPAPGGIRDDPTAHAPFRRARPDGWMGNF
jgi:hypothetical protein